MSSSAIFQLSTQNARECTWISVRQCTTKGRAPNKLTKTEKSQQQIDSQSVLLLLSQLCVADSPQSRDHPCRPVVQSRDVRTACSGFGPYGFANDRKAVCSQHQPRTRAAEISMAEAAAAFAPRPAFRFSYGTYFLRPQQSPLSTPLAPSPAARCSKFTGPHPGSSISAARHVDVGTCFPARAEARGGGDGRTVSRTKRGQYRTTGSGLRLN